MSLFNPQSVFQSKVFPKAASAFLTVSTLLFASPALANEKTFINYFSDVGIDICRQYDYSPSSSTTEIMSGDCYKSYMGRIHGLLNGTGELYSATSDTCMKIMSESEIWDLLKRTSSKGAKGYCSFIIRNVANSTTTPIKSSDDGSTPFLKLIGKVYHEMSKQLFEALDVAIAAEKKQKEEIARQKQAESERKKQAEIARQKQANAKQSRQYYLDLCWKKQAPIAYMPSDLYDCNYIVDRYYNNNWDNNKMSAHVIVAREGTRKDMAEYPDAKNVIAFLMSYFRNKCFKIQNSESYIIRCSNELFNNMFEVYMKWCFKNAKSNHNCDDIVKIAEEKNSSLYTSLMNIRDESCRGSYSSRTCDFPQSMIDEVVGELLKDLADPWGRINNSADCLGTRDSCLS